MDGVVMTEGELKTLARGILDSVPGGMEGPDIAGLAMLLVSILVFKSPPESREEVVDQLERGFHAAIADGKARAAQREAPKQ
jgi:hypothetical protein